MTTLRRLTLAGLLALAASHAHAHPGHGGAALAAGFAHPFSGVDHLLAMLAVGLLAARRGPGVMLLWPTAFVLAMLVGYGLGLAGLQAPMVEPAILASVIVLGALAASTWRVPAAAGAALIGVFGLCHGLAHGAEAPVGAGAGYVMGFAVATALLHAVGLALGWASLRAARPGLLRLLGTGVAAGGLALVLAG